MTISSWRDITRSKTSKAVVTAGALRLGGTVLLDGELFRVDVPERLRSAAKVRASYENATFKGSLAMRTRNAQFLGLGYPVIDALIEYLRCRNRNGERFRHVHPPAVSS